jgi:uncharacterized protein YjbI with pentapeptide repeats
MKKNVRRTIIRILTAVIGILGLIFFILLIEDIFGPEKECLPRETWIFCQIRESTLLELAEGFSILAAVLLFLMETPQRNKQAHYEAWKVIDASHGLKTSYARFQALQDLNEDSVSLSGLNAPEADLKSINLAGADLRNAYLSGADLSFANLSNANLSHANLVEANLSNANLSNAHLTGANLSYADMIETDLQDTDFVGANLLGVNFVRADLSQAYFGDVNLGNCLFTDANLRHTKFFGIENLTPEQIKAAKNWREGIYDTGLHRKLGL